MANTGRLAIYDSADSAIANIGRDRAADAHIGADSVAKLCGGLDQLLGGKQQFRRVVFDTHGAEGTIWLGDQEVSADTWRTKLKGKGYDRLFPFFSKMYFSGCNVSDDDVGWSFLEAASEAFFGVGGVTMGYTSLGFTTRWGHFNPKHLWGEVRLVISMPGKKPRRVSGGDMIQMMMSGDVDRELMWVLREMDII